MSHIDVSKHYDRQAKEQRSQRLKSRIIQLRRSNNQVKRRLIDENLSQIAAKINDEQRDDLYVLDVGCGKGGDLAKYGEWCNQNQTTVHLFGIDLSNDCIAEAHLRYAQNKNRWPLLHATFAVADFCAADRGGWPDEWPIAYDLISMQFTVHYAFAAVSMLRRLLDNVARASAWPHCTVIGSTVDYGTVVRRLSNSCTVDDNAQALTVGNDVYEMCMPQADVAKLCARASGSPYVGIFGVGYDMYLHDCVDHCREYLVDRDALCDLLQHIGFQCVLWQRFDEFNPDHMRTLSTAEAEVYASYVAFTFRRQNDDQCTGEN